MSHRTIAQLKDATSPADSSALAELMKQKDLIVNELRATKTKLDTAVALGDISAIAEHAHDVAPEDIESHVRTGIAQLLNIDRNAVQWPASLDDLSLSQLEKVWDIIKKDETEADHLISASGGAGVLK